MTSQLEDTGRVTFWPGDVWELAFAQAAVRQGDLAGGRRKVAKELYGAGAGGPVLITAAGDSGQRHAAVSARGLLGERLDPGPDPGVDGVATNVKFNRARNAE